jgi:hypothetical protein
MGNSIMLANIISSLTKYAGNWNVTDSRKFTAEEISLVTKAQVVPSQYGSSLCLFLKSGQQSFIPLSNTATAKDGDVVNLNEATLMCLSREGDDDIYRVEC